MVLWLRCVSLPRLSPLPGGITPPSKARPGILAADSVLLSAVANFDPSTFSLMRCEFCGAGFDTRAGLSSHARAHLRDFGITNWELTISPINILKELLANSAEHPMLQAAVGAEPSSPGREAHGFVPRKSGTPMSECSIPRSPLSPFPPSWGDESLQSYRDGECR